VILFEAALLEQNPPALVDDENRKGAMEETGLVHGGLAGRSDRTVVFIDQDELLFGHWR
jgi:hypothetical protein